MAVPSLPGVWAATVQQSLGTITFENVIHVMAPFTASPSAVAQDVAHAWAGGSGFAIIQSIRLTYGNIIVQPYDGASAPTTVSPSGFTGTHPTATNNAMPVQSCHLTTLRTGLAGRTHRGRLYVSGVDETFAAVDGTRWDAASMATLQNAPVVMLGRLQSGTVTTAWVVYSHKTNTAQPITSVLVRQYFGTQRRRSEQAQHH